MFADAPHETPVCNLCKGDRVTIIRQPNFVQCRNCRLRFYSPRPTWQALVDKIWNPGNVSGLRKEAESMYFKGVMWGEPEDPEAQIHFVKSFYKEFIEKIRIYRPDLNSIFEIGGSIGRFLEVARDDFGITTVDGCEINDEAVRIANRNLGLHGMVAGDFLGYHATRLYDCIVALDYIEHTYSPNEDIKKASEMLNPGGALVIKTFLEELDPLQSMVDYPWHSHHFFGDVLFRMVTQNNFRIVHWETAADNQIFLIALKHEIPSYYASSATD